jgi:hypothetical protein
MPISWPAPTRPTDDVSESDASEALSYPSSDASFDSEDHAALIQEEWEESLRQIESVISVILLPFFGKWYGRRVAFWGESECEGGDEASSGPRLLRYPPARRP